MLQMSCLTEYEGPFHFRQTGGVTAVSGSSASRITSQCPRVKFLVHAQKLDAAAHTFYTDLRASQTTTFITFPLLDLTSGTMAGLFAKATSMLSSLPIDSVVGTCFGQFDKDKSGFVEVGYTAC